MLDSPRHFSDAPGDSAAMPGLWLAKLKWEMLASAQVPYYRSDPMYLERLHWEAATEALLRWCPGTDLHH